MKAHMLYFNERYMETMYTDLSIVIPNSKNLFSSKNVLENSAFGLGRKWL